MFDRRYGLYLRGLVLADVQARADSADTGHSPGLNVGGGQFSGGVRVPVQRGGQFGYGGYTAGCGCGYGLAQQVRKRRAEPERDGRQALQRLNRWGL